MHSTLEFIGICVVVAVIALTVDGTFRFTSKKKIKDSYTPDGEFKYGVTSETLDGLNQDEESPKEM